MGWVAMALSALLVGTPDRSRYPGQLLGLESAEGQEQQEESLQAPAQALQHCLPPSFTTRDPKLLVDQ